jgi:hypothetical protein
VERDPDHGYITAIVLDVTDTAGRAMHMRGTPVSRLAMPLPGLAAVVWTSTVSWNIDSTECWGEDQDPWPLGQWSMRRRNGEFGALASGPDRRNR